MIYFLHGKPFTTTPRKSEIPYRKSGINDNYGVNIRAIQLKTNEEWEDDNRRKEARNRV